MKGYDDYVRWMYHGGHPNRLAQILNHASAWAFSAGVWPKRAVTLEVPGRRTGRTIACPLVIVAHQGERYLVSMLGEDTNWVHNVRAAGGEAMIRHGRREHVHLEPVEPSKRPPVLRRYLECAPGARPHIPVDRQAPDAAFEEIAASIPVFRVLPSPRPSMRRAG